MDKETGEQLSKIRGELLTHFCESLIQMNAVRGGSQCFVAAEAHLMFLATLDKENKKRIMDLSEEFLRHVKDADNFSSFTDIHQEVELFLVEKGIYLLKPKETNESSEINTIDQETSQAY